MPNGEINKPSFGDHHPSNGAIDSLFSRAALMFSQLTTVMNRELIADISTVGEGGTQ